MICSVIQCDSEAYTGHLKGEESQMPFIWSFQMEVYKNSYCTWKALLVNDYKG